jgi:hypothetical protein
MEQPPFAAPHDHILFVQIGGKAEPVETGAGAHTAPVIPGASRAANRSVDQVRHIRQRQQGDLRAVERATARRGAGFRGATAGFLFVIVFAGGFIQQRENVISLHSDLIDLLGCAQCCNSQARNELLISKRNILSGLRQRRQLA